MKKQRNQLVKRDMLIFPAIKLQKNEVATVNWSFSFGDKVLPMYITREVIIKPKKKAK